MTYLILEPFIHGKALSKNDLKNGDVKRQFLEIIAAKKPRKNLTASNEHKLIKEKYKP